MRKFNALNWPSLAALWTLLFVASLPAAESSFIVQTDGSWGANVVFHLTINGHQLAGIWPTDNSSAPYSADFRKVFTIPGVPTNGTMDVFFDDDGVASINGHVIFRDTSGSAANPAVNLDVTQFLQTGENVIDLHVDDQTRSGTSGGHYGMCWLKVTQTVPEYSLNISSAHGTVEKTPDQSTYTNGSEVTLKVVAAQGYRFAGWSGDASGKSNPLTLVMNSNKSVTATFEGNPIKDVLIKWDKEVAFFGSYPDDVQRFGEGDRILGKVVIDPKAHLSNSKIRWQLTATGSPLPLLKKSGSNFVSTARDETGNQISLVQGTYTLTFFYDDNQDGILDRVNEFWSDCEFDVLPIHEIYLSVAASRGIHMNNKAAQRLLSSNALNLHRRDSVTDVRALVEFKLDQDVQKDQSIPYRIRSNDDFAALAAVQANVKIVGEFAPKADDGQRFTIIDLPGGGGIAGYCFDGPRNATVTFRAASEGAISHEIGHTVLGAGHRDERANLMFKAAPAGRDLDKSQADSFMNAPAFASPM